MASTGFFVSEEKAATLLTLIVDRKGIFGKHIAEKIHKDITTVLVTLKEEPSEGNTIVVPYTKTIPEIPEGNYSHIFFVWDGRRESLHVLEPLLKKAAMDNAQFLFITDYHFYNEKLVRFIHQEHAKTSILFTGDIFGNDAYESTVTHLFKQALKEGTLRLENVGLKHVYPVLFSDVVAKILHVGFGVYNGKILLALQQHGMTQLSLAHIVQKVDPLIKIDFSKEDTPATHLPQAEYLFDGQYDVKGKLQEVYTDEVVRNRQVHENHGEFYFSPVAIKQEEFAQKKRKKVWLYMLLFVVVIVVSPVVFTAFYAGLGGVVLYATGNAIRNGDYQEAVNYAQTSKNLFAVAASANTLSQQEFQTMLLQNTGRSITNAIAEGNFFAVLLSDGAQAARSFSVVTKGTSISPQADFLIGVNAVKNALVLLNETPWQGSIAGVSLATLSQSLPPIGSVLDVAPQLFGFSGEKTYLILFQNNMELRPGGGFIGSFGLVTVNNGKITDFSIHDVYDADGQLKGHVEPPYVIRRYIPQQHWYLRDSNFDVDFSQDAQTAAFFLQQELGQRVDGVVAIDLTFIKDVLAGIGPVYVPEYNVTVTADNLFLLTESHVEKNSFVGSTQKKDFLRALFAAIQTKFTSSHGVAPQAIVPLLSAVSKKDVLFGFSDPLIQDVFTVNGLSSSLWDGRKQDKTELNDSTGINEANIGVNKANYFITRSVEQDMSIDKTGSVSGQLKITYTNASTKGQWPGGAYKNYLRVILPAGAVLTGIVIDGKSQILIPAITDASIYEGKNFVAPQGLEVDSATEENKQLYGFVITIPEQTTQTIGVRYTLSQKIDISSPTNTYNGWLIKQPGVDVYPYTFTLHFPGSLTLLQKPSWMTQSGNSISFTKSFDEDTLFSLQFSQK